MSAKSMPELLNHKVYLTLTAVVFLAGALFFVWLGLNRLIALDEGFYTYAAKLVMQGQIPAKDFFYPQMPYLPYLYGIWMEIWGYTWSAARVLSSLLGVALGMLVFVEVMRLAGKELALFSLLLFFLSVLVFPWYTIVKTYAPSHLFLFLSWVSIFYIGKRRRGLLFFIAGASFAIACAMRLYLGAMLPALLWSVYLNSAGLKDFLRNVRAFLFGGVLAALPLLYFVVPDTEAFIFNNLGYHLGRDRYDTTRSFMQKGKVLSALLGLSSQKVYEYQFALLLWPAALFGFYRTIKEKRLEPYLFAILTLLVTSLLPSPVYEQYFSVLAPFVICSFCMALSSIRLMKARAVLITVFSIAYLFTVPRDINRFVRSGLDVPGINNATAAEEWTLSFVRDVSKIINTLTQPGEEVISLWPGYLVETHATSLPGTENHFGPEAAAQLNGDKRSAYHILSSEEIVKLLKEKKVRYLIARPRSKGVLSGENLQGVGLKPLKRIGSLEVYSTQ